MPWSRWIDDINPATGQPWVYLGEAAIPDAWRYSHKVWTTPGPGNAIGGLQMAPAPGWSGDSQWWKADYPGYDPPVDRDAWEQAGELTGFTDDFLQYDGKQPDGTFLFPTSFGPQAYTWHVGPGHGYYGIPADNVGFNPRASFTPTCVWRQHTGKSSVFEAGRGDGGINYYSGVNQVENSAIGAFADLENYVAHQYPNTFYDFQQQAGIPPVHTGPGPLLIEYEAPAANFHGWLDLDINIRWSMEWADGEVTRLNKWYSSALMPPPFTMEWYYTQAPLQGGQPKQLPDWVEPASRVTQLKDRFTVDPAAQGLWGNLDPGVGSPGDQRLSLNTQGTLRLSQIPWSAVLLHCQSDVFNGGNIGPPLTNYPIPPDWNAAASDWNSHHIQAYGFQAYTTDSPTGGGLWFPQPKFHFTYPRFRYWIAEESQLRLSQRNDGRGTARAPRLHSSAGGAPSSRQHSRAPRVGDHDHYR